MIEATLMPHQLAALKRLRVSGGKQLLNLCPGAGKTLTAITYLKELNQYTSYYLVVCPASVIGVWEDELKKWSEFTFQRVQGSPKKRKTQWLSKQTVKIVSYETFLRDSKQAYFKNLPWDCLILDESHKVKNPTAKISKALRQFAKDVRHKLLLSGTPLVNGYGDIWNQVETIKPGSLYGNWYIFRNMHAVMPIPGIPAIRGWKNTQDILNKIEPYMFTIDKLEIQKHLPPVTMTTIPVELSKDERVAYEKAKEEFLIEIKEDRDLTIPNALVKIGRLRQICNGLFPFGFDVSSKAQALDEILETLAGEKVIVFSMYAETIKYLQKRLRCQHVITGDTVYRDAVLADWRARGTLLLGTQAMSTGINLQEAHYVIQCEPSWTKAEEDQRIARAWRTGQVNPVTVYNLVARNTIDEYVRKVIARKAETANEVASFTMKEIEEMV